jgi:hypothetical protein
MQFLNKSQRSHDKLSVTHDDIIKSVKGIMDNQDRNIFLEEFAGQGTALEFFRDTDGKLKVNNVKTKVTTILDTSVLPSNVIDILNKYFAENKDPVDILLNAQGQVLRVNPEVTPDASSLDVVKQAISKSNLWRLKNAVNKADVTAQQPINEEVVYSEGVTINNSDDAEEVIAIAVSKLKQYEPSVSGFADTVADAVCDGIFSEWSDAEAKRIIQQMIVSLKGELKHSELNGQDTEEKPAK